MINNEFNIIGIAVSEYESDSWGNHVLRVEIEKMGSKEGNVFEAEVKVYGNNRMVDVKRAIKGEQIAVNGYIDFFTSKKGAQVLRLVAQRVYVLGEQKKRRVDSATTESQGSAEPHLAEREEDYRVPDVDVVDDDLPF